MKHQLQSKESKARLLYMLLIILVGLIILGLAVFYFLPIPKSLNSIVKSGAKVERCIYRGGVGYNARLEIESFNGGLFSETFYNVQGEPICSSGGYTGKQPEGPCAQKMCFSIYDN